MDIRIKSYFTLSEALSDQASLSSQGIESNLENTQDIHPTILGQVFLSVKKENAVEAIKILNEDLLAG